ncbi:MAG: Ger(x)C family spore germination C-terminal domain-containing protein [Candidatus Coproplasma sp.]
MNRESLFKRLSGLFIALLISVLSALFFTNDFGLVDLRKTSVIIGVGVDFDNQDEMMLTAQLAVPMPAENGENTQFTVVTGKGTSVAEALNDINVKTGYYPKLVFCKLIVVGESCFDKDINSYLNYFFSNEYSGLTPKIAACKGKASELFSLKLPYGDSVTDSVDRLLSDEAQKSANVSTANLNGFGQGYYSKSRASYMPYIEVSGAGGESGAEQEEGESGGDGDSSTLNSQSQGGESGENVEFFCGKTAVFTEGKLAGVLSEEQAFAFNLLNGDIRRTYVACENGERAATISIRDCKGDISLKVEKGIPVLKLSFSAAAKVQDDKTKQNKQRGENETSKEILQLGEQTIKGFMEGLYAYTSEIDCDLLGAKDLLYKKQNKYFETLNDSITKTLTVVYEIKLRSAG